MIIDKDDATHILTLLQIAETAAGFPALKYIHTSALQDLQEIAGDHAEVHAEAKAEADAKAQEAAIEAAKKARAEEVAQKNADAASGDTPKVIPGKGRR